MRERGFTLIEMLVVLAVIALLVVVVLAAVNDGRSKGRYAQMIGQMKIIATAAEAYKNDVASSSYAVAVGEAVAPAFVTDTSAKWLQDWPDTPCKNPGLWRYDWDNTGVTVRIEAVKFVGAVWTAQFTYCLQPTTGCQAAGQVTNNAPTGRLDC